MNIRPITSTTNATAFGAHKEFTTKTTSGLTETEQHYRLDQLLALDETFVKNVERINSDTKSVTAITLHQNTLGIDKVTTPYHLDFATSPLNIESKIKTATTENILFDFETTSKAVIAKARRTLTHVLEIASKWEITKGIRKV